MKKNLIFDYKKIILPFFILFSLNFCLNDEPQVQKKKIVALDYYFNNEWKEGKRFHYIWEDEAFSGFSDLGKIITNLNAEIISLDKAPSKELLRDIDLYIIVDPDTEKETENPNFIDVNSRKEIADWVQSGGILMLMANDSGNCEFKNLNLLSEEFGIHFNEVSINRVTGKNFDMGKINNFPDQTVFENVKQIYLKEISTFTLEKDAKPFLIHNDEIIMATAKYGKGFVFAVGDPWLYNEYIDDRKLPPDFENYKAAENLFRWLLSDINKKNNYN